MLLVLKLFLVAFAVIGQSKAFPEREAAEVSELDTVPLPADHPERVLARRAMAREGLCAAPEAKHAPLPAAVAAKNAIPDPPIEDRPLVRLVAEACD